MLLLYLIILARRYGRRSHLVEERIKSISLELTSRKVSSLLHLLHITASSSSCLRILQQCGHAYFGRVLQRLGVKSFRKAHGVYYHVVTVEQRL